MNITVQYNNNNNNNNNNNSILIKKYLSFCHLENPSLTSQIKSIEYIMFSLICFIFKFYLRHNNLIKNFRRRKID